jgi:hypothetical protein
MSGRRKGRYCAPAHLCDHFASGLRQDHLDEGDSAVMVLDAAPSGAKGHRGADPHATGGLPASRLVIITFIDNLDR